MPVYESRRTMKYGPGRHPAQVFDGDEIPAPVKRNLLERGWVVEVEAYRGRSWAQIEAERDAAEQELIDDMPAGPAKDKAQAQLDAVKAQPIEPKTLHPSKLAEPGDYFNTADPHAKGKEKTASEVHHNRETIETMLEGPKKQEALADLIAREEKKIGEMKRGSAKSDAMKNLEELRSMQVAAPLPAPEVVPAAPESAGSALDGDVDDTDPLLGSDLEDEDDVLNPEPTKRKRGRPRK